MLVKKSRDGNDYEVINAIICTNDTHYNGNKMLGYTYGKLYYEVKTGYKTRRFLDDDADLRILYESFFRNATLLEKELYSD